MLRGRLSIQYLKQTNVNGDVMSVFQVSVDQTCQPVSYHLAQDLLLATLCFYIIDETQFRRL